MLPTNIIDLRYNIATSPYRVNIWSIIDSKTIKEDLLKPQQFQKHTTWKIQKIASALSSEDVMVAIRNAVIWILRNIKYEKTYRRYSVTDTLSRRKGSCLSIADLLVAILRAMNIPARVVRGLYMNRLHAWVEAYIERKDGIYVIPIDPLAGIVGALGSIWISHHAELDPRQKEVEVNSSIHWKYSIVVEYP